MSYLRIPFVILVGLLLGCGSTTHISELDYEKTNQELLGKQVDIELVNGETYKGESVKIDVDTTSWISMYANALVRHAFPTEEIGKVIVVNRSGGAAQGLMAGVFIGVGFAVLYTEVLADWGKDLEGSAQEATKVIGIGLMGIPVGILVGASGGAMKTYVLHEFEPFDIGDDIIIVTNRDVTYVGKVVTFNNYSVELETLEGVKSIPMRSVKWLVKRDE